MFCFCKSVLNLWLSPTWNEKYNCVSLQLCCLLSSGSYASLPRGGSGGAAVAGYGSTPAQPAPERQTIGNVAHGAAVVAPGVYPDQKNYVPGTQYGAGAGQAGTYPGGKQVYEGSAAEWDGNAYRERQFREETETSNDGTRSYSQVKHIMSLIPNPILKSKMVEVIVCIPYVYYPIIVLY